MSFFFSSVSPRAASFSPRAAFLRQAFHSVCAAFVFGVVLVGSSSHATVVVLDDLATMVHRADVVAHIKVLSQQTLREKGRL
ncbi:MAG: hypothetical protein GY822_16150 [Deltaproteobacteria bacterium]|nr:hypothetical protein [Deltaproteobacteria bacterium]